MNPWFYALFLPGKQTRSFWIGILEHTVHLPLECRLAATGNLTAYFTIIHLNITTDKHFAPDSKAKAPLSPNWEATDDLSSLGLEEISSCSGSRSSILTPHFQQGFHLLCQLSAQNVFCLSHHSFQLNLYLSAHLPPHFLSKVRNEVLHYGWISMCILEPQQLKYCWCIWQASFSPLYSHSGPTAHDSKHFSVCHCAVTSIITSKSAFCLSVLRWGFFYACWSSCILLPREHVDFVALACFKAWCRLAPRLALKLVETDGQTNEPLKSHGYDPRFD